MCNDTVLSFNGILGKLAHVNVWKRKKFFLQVLSVSGIIGLTPDHTDT